MAGVGEARRYATNCRRDSFDGSPPVERASGFFGIEGTGTELFVDFFGKAGVGSMRLSIFLWITGFRMMHGKTVFFS